MSASRSPSPDAVPPDPPQQQQEPVINPSAFKGGFSEANLLAYLARDFLRERSLQNSEGSAPAAAKASLIKVQKLLGTLDK